MLQQWPADGAESWLQRGMRFPRRRQEEAEEAEEAAEAEKARSVRRGRKQQDSKLAGEDDGKEHCNPEVIALRGQGKHGFAAHIRGACSLRCCGESPRAVGQRVSAGDR